MVWRRNVNLEATMKSLIIAVITLAACAGTAGAEEEKLLITPAVWQGYQDYLASITATGGGFFAVSQDGRSWSGVGCASGCNLGAKAQQKAKDECAKASGGKSCVLFAKGHEVVVPYEIVQ
jgi:hypothetical protein